MKKTIAVIMAAICLLAAGCTHSERPGVIEVIVPETPEPAITPPPTPSPTPEPNVYVYPYADKLAAAAEKNSDVVGYISINGTHIDYPILYGQGWFYDQHDIDKMPAKDIGCIYSLLNKAQSEANKVDQNIVITGHNTRIRYSDGIEENNEAKIKQGMFHELHHIQAVNEGKTSCGYDKCKAVLDPAALPNLKTPEGRTWDISIFGIDAQWEVWALYETKADEPENTLYYNIWYPGKKHYYVPKDGAEVQEWINKQLKRSEIDLGVEVTTNDQFMTIYTCGDRHHDMINGKKCIESKLYIFLKQVNPVSTKFVNGVRVENGAAPLSTPGA